jgi:hypothetical protein
MVVIEATWWILHKCTLRGRRREDVGEKKTRSAINMSLHVHWFLNINQGSVTEMCEIYISCID